MQASRFKPNFAA